MSEWPVSEWTSQSDQIRVVMSEWSNQSGPSQSSPIRVAMSEFMSEWPIPEWSTQSGPSHGRASYRDVHPMGVPLSRAFLRRACLIGVYLVGMHLKGECLRLSDFSTLGFGKMSLPLTLYRRI
jgi:hypothetical protein